MKCGQKPKLVYVFPTKDTLIYRWIFSHSKKCAKLIRIFFRDEKV